MKISDFAPRTGFIETYLTGNNLTGAEIGVDAGAHAESLLRYCSIEKLWLIDPWLNIYMEGYCAGRLSKWRNKICMEKSTSQQFVKNFEGDFLSFVYLDREHTYEAGRFDLENWWLKLKPGGIMALRNYNGNPGLTKAADEFKDGKRYEVENYLNEIIFFK